MLIILDWDGTLADSRDLIVGAMCRSAEMLALPIPKASAVAPLIGLGLPEAIDSLFPDASPSLREKFRHTYSENFVTASQQQGATRFFPDVLDSLHALRENGHALSIATGKSRRGLDRVLAADGIAALFVATRAADETRSKPHPLMLQELLAETGTALSDAVMVGDTTYDMAMAESIGMSRIGVSYGVHTVDQLLAHDPVEILDNFSALLDCAMLE